MFRARTCTSAVAFIRALECQDVSPLKLFIAEETIGRDGVGPIAAGLWDAGRGICAQALDQANRAPVTPGVSQINALKFGGSPVHQFLMLLNQ